MSRRHLALPFPQRRRGRFDGAVRLKPAEDFRELVAAESARLARLCGLLTGSRERGRELAEVALARALLRWNRLRAEEPGGALRRCVFEVYGQWWRHRLRRYPAAPESAAGRLLAAVPPRQRAIALLAAEGRSQTETAQLLGLADRAVARGWPDPAQPELAAVLSTVDDPIPMDRVVARAGRLRRQRWAGAGVGTALILAVAAPVTSTLRYGPRLDQASRLCPTQLPATVGGSAADLAGTLIPITPTQMVVCRYSSDGQRSEARAVDSATAAIWVSALNAAPAVTDQEVCSREPAEPYLILLSGAGRTVMVWAEPSGCGQVTNGVRIATAGRDLLWQISANQPRSGPEPAVLACAGTGGMPVNDGAGLTGRLVGFPASRIVVCPDGADASVAALTGTAARSLAARLDAAPVLSGVPSGCPSPRRLTVVLTGGVQRIDLSVDTAPCGWATNGRRVVRLDPVSRQALLRLAHLPG